MLWCAPIRGSSHHPPKPAAQAVWKSNSAMAVSKSDPAKVLVKNLCPKNRPNRAVCSSYRHLAQGMTALGQWGAFRLGGDPCLGRKTAPLKHHRGVQTSSIAEAGRLHVHIHHRKNKFCPAIRNIFQKYIGRLGNSILHDYAADSVPCHS